MTVLNKNLHHNTDRRSTIPRCQNIGAHCPTKSLSGGGQRTGAAQRAYEQYEPQNNPG